LASVHKIIIKYLPESHRASARKHSGQPPIAVPQSLCASEPTDGAACSPDNRPKRRCQPAPALIRPVVASDKTDTMQDDTINDELIGCCGAYCRTCMSTEESSCRGCRIGYADRTRSAHRSRCKIKRCCLMDHDLPTCMHCAEFATCPLLNNFYARFKGRALIKAAALFIRKHGYRRFCAEARDWVSSRGPLPDK